MDDFDFLDLPPVKPAPAKPDPVAEFKATAAAIDIKHVDLLVEGARAVEKLHNALAAEKVADPVDAPKCLGCGATAKTLDEGDLCVFCRADEPADDAAVGMGDADAQPGEIDPPQCTRCNGTGDNLPVHEGACYACNGRGYLDAAAPPAPLDPVAESKALAVEEAAHYGCGGCGTHDDLNDAGVCAACASAVVFGPIVPPDAAPPEQPVAREEKSVDRIGLPTAAVRVLMRNNFETIGDLRARRHEIASLRGIGAKTIDAINAALDADDSAPQPGEAVVERIVERVDVRPLPVVVTIGSVSMLVEPGAARIIDVDDIVGGAPNAGEVIAAFLASTPFDSAQPTRLHVLSSAPYVDAVLDWARAAGVFVFGGRHA